MVVRDAREDGREELREFAPIATSMTDADGIAFATAIPDRPEVQDFLHTEADRGGVSVEEVREAIATRGYAYYVLDELRAGHLTQSDTANLLGVHYTDFYRMAYSTGALELPPVPAALITGEPDDHIKAMRGLPDVVVEEISYRSSMEDLSPLYAEVAYDPQRTGAPVLVVQHGGYPANRFHMLPECVEFARTGFFCIAVSKRGRDGSATQGSADGSGAIGDALCRETMDIVDAVDYCLTQYGEYLDPNSVNVYGTSAGGVDVLACVVHFPDTFRCAIAMYPGWIDLRDFVEVLNSEDPVYELAGPSSPSSIVESGRAERNRVAALLTSDVGGPPEQWPDRWLARDLSRYGVNNPYTRTFFLSDEEDGFAGKKRFRGLLRAYLDDQAKYGYTNSEAVQSKVGDPQRFMHWTSSDQRFFYHRFVPALLSGTFPRPVLSRLGRLAIPGFVRTKPFTVWLGRGDDAVASLIYELGGSGGVFRFRRLSRDPSKRGRLILHREDGDEEIEFGLDDTVVVPEGGSRLRFR